MSYTLNMTFVITELLFGNFNTIKIPITSDSIFLLPILIGLGLIISCSQYIFRELQERKIFVLSKNQIENQLDPKECVQEILPTETTIINKLSSFSSPKIVGLGSLAFNKLSSFSSPKIVGLGSLAFIALGGSGLLALQATNKNLPNILKTSDLNNPREVKSKKSESLSFNPQNISITSKKELQKIKYISPSFSQLKRSKNKEYTLIKPIKNQSFAF